MPAINSLANLRNSAPAALAAASGTCPACTGVGRLHDCENFPISPATVAYLDCFDSFLSRPDDSVPWDDRPTVMPHPLLYGIATPTPGTTRTRSEFLTDMCSDLADTLTALDALETDS